MIALIQRVSQASVVVCGEQIAQIDTGLLVLLGVEKTDDAVKADKLIHRLLGYRIFEDPQGKMNLSVQDIKGEVLLVPQFTLVADTKSGMRPGFSQAAPPEEGESWFNYVAKKCESVLGKIQLGQFGADMQVGLINNGPATFWLQV